MYEERIPRVIHYCWFGGGPKPRVFEKCLESWKKYMPGFEIIEWNEGNTNLNSCRFVQQAYKEKKWAFVSDVVRLQVVYEMGGIYMDTDVELFRSLEEYLKYDAVFFFQNHSQIATGLGFGAVKGNQLLKKMIDDYNETDFSLKKINQLACPVKNTKVICGFLPMFEANSHTQLCDNMLFVDYDTYYSGARHYGEFSWRDEEQNELLKYAKKKRGFWRLRRILRSPEIFLFFDKLHMKRVSQVYTFLVYDFIDQGALYWGMKVFYKIKNRIKNR